MSLVEMSLVLVALLMPFIGAKLILDYKIRDYMKMNMYLSVMKFILFVIALMVSLSLLNIDVIIKSAIISYVVFSGTVYLGLVFQRTYFQHSVMLDEKVKEYQNKKGR